MSNAKPQVPKPNLGHPATFNTKHFGQIRGLKVIKPIMSNVKTQVPKPNLGQPGLRLQAKTYGCEFRWVVVGGVTCHEAQSQVIELLGILRYPGDHNIRINHFVGCVKV